MKGWLKEARLKCRDEDTIKLVISSRTLSHEVYPSRYPNVDFRANYLTVIQLWNSGILKALKNCKIHDP